MTPIDDLSAIIALVNKARGAVIGNTAATSSLTIALNRLYILRSEVDRATHLLLNNQNKTVEDAISDLSTRLAFVDACDHFVEAIMEDI